MTSIQYNLDLEVTEVEAAKTVDFGSYDHIIVAFSGGKDSLACLLHLFDLGVNREKIELWHHDIDGREGSTLMDWPVTRDYCRKVAQAFNLPIYFSWKQGGFEREMTRDGTATAPTMFETPDGLQSRGGQGKPGTRLKFPQVAADLKVRWCSAYLKIDVGSVALRNQDRFNGKRTLFVTGERAQESTSRARYKVFEPHRTHGNKRHVDHYRPVHGWSEEQVWEIIRDYRVAAHPAYALGWGRLSCACCIFGDDNQWASHRVVLPDAHADVVKYENSFGTTIHRQKTITERADSGTPYEMDPALIELARSEIYDLPIIVDTWALPSGAYGPASGPT
ncbi:phosphoadenosine phosphosulfate reductase family protein [Thalassospira xianhensis]|uniref:Phosphoadenosine phosphosulfate reductase n=1 Tax=Thalassospira xianhensis MCCC 1A02616 TaxID=1177929 RepID=A0A367UH80_9PROT|nr:phosphoadenosine phosphosulfate reductase family protein [Thalassospira xianhensis]RCK07568.1 phosphoadenosine phosphosulfate reductase [Thalassospira xianhensis MCCC 1A02616]